MRASPPTAGGPAWHGASARHFLCPSLQPCLAFAHTEHCEKIVRLDPLAGGAARGAAGRTVKAPVSRRLLASSRATTRESCRRALSSSSVVAVSNNAVSKCNNRGCDAIWKNYDGVRICLCGVCLIVSPCIGTGCAGAGRGERAARHSASAAHERQHSLAGRVGHRALAAMPRDLTGCGRCVAPAPAREAGSGGGTRARAREGARSVFPRPRRLC